jgi:BlaI family penicillinase repressor
MRLAPSTAHSADSKTHKVLMPKSPLPSRPQVENVNIDGPFLRPYTFHMMKRKLMARPKRPLPTNAEQVILNALWDLKEGTVDDVVTQLPASPPANYKTVQSLLRILEAKGFVRHTVRGRAFLFSPKMTREEVGGNLTKNLLERTFQGSCSALMMNLLDAHDVKDEELDELEALIQGYRERKKEQAPE